MARRTATGKGARGARPRGFTLIELLVVMSIIATLLMIAVPRYLHSIERSREAVLRQDLSVMRDAIDKYFADRAQYPQTLADLVEHRYLRAIPADPETKSRDTWVPVLSEDDNNPGILDVKSGSKELASDGTAFESW